MSGKNKIAIIIHKVNEKNYNICKEAVHNLKIPFGLSVDFYTIKSNTGRAEDRANIQEKIDADIKIYIDDYVWVLDDNLLINIERTFRENVDIALIGLVGTNDVPVNGIAQNSWNIVGEFCKEDGKRYGKKITKITDCLSVFGGIMALRFNVDWQEDTFNNRCFYDTAITLELQQKGYKTVLIPQAIPAIWNDMVLDEHIDETVQDFFLDKYSQALFPLVSILIPTYCRPVYFEKALQSALAQTYRNIEIFITDNSPDRRTANIIVAKYAKNKKVKYEHHPEISTAYDNCLIARKYNNPQAEYVQWLMDDDILLPEKIAVMVDCYRMHPQVTLVTSYRQMIDAEGNPLPDCAVNQPIVPQNALISGRIIGKNILMNMMNFLGEPTTVLIRKKFLLNNDWGWTGNEGKAIISDFPTWLNLCAQGDVIYLHEPYSLWRIHGGNQQLSLDVIHLGCVCWAMMIIHAWRNKIFLEDTGELDTAVARWFKTAASHIIDTRNKNVVSEWDKTFRQYFGYMSELLQESRN